MHLEELKTVKQALEWTRDMWDWLAANPGKFKEEWPGWETRAECAANCACCEIARRSCEDCPLLKAWKAKKADGPFLACCSDKSPYTKWKEAREDFAKWAKPEFLVAETKAAKQIANAARKALCARK